MTTKAQREEAVRERTEALLAEDQEQRKLCECEHPKSRHSAVETGYATDGCTVPVGRDLRGIASLCPCPGYQEAKP